MSNVYKICVLNTHRDFFDYQITTAIPCIGARVWVPFRKQTRLGIVIGEQTSPSQNELKAVLSIIDETAIITQPILELCQWVATYYQTPLSEVIPLALPKNYRLGKPCQLPMDDYFQLAISTAEAYQLVAPRARKQRALIEFLEQYGKAASKKLLQQEGFGSTQINPLLAQNILTLTQQVSLPAASNQLSTPLTLNAEQDLAVKTIHQHLSNYHCFLLHGVTGSGKTEVYLQVIASVLAQGKQVLVLVPEIGLTPQLLSRFTERFSQPMVVIHSNLNESERQFAWQFAKDNIVKLVIGTRTAVFTPMPGLGLIVIDEEHDSSLKQMEGVRYSARDTALMRARSANIPIILGSATPSLESLHNCSQKKYTLLRLNEKALSTSPLHYQIIDIRNKPLQHGIAAQTLAIIAEHLQRNNQVMVFINRRGFAPVLLCHHCGWMADCKTCDSHLTLHRQLSRLVCHHCGRIESIPLRCKACNNNELLPIGAGTQRVHEYLSECFPTTKLLRIDRDEVQKKEAFNQHLDSIHRGDTQLIVGTQMLAKGHHFPRLTLVVVLDTDAGFYNQDFRALERLGQLLTQVSGRAGRAEHAGQVVIQTHLPHHPLLNLLIQQGYDPFAESLLTLRQQTEFPPYHFLALIRAQDKSATKVLQFMHLIKEQLLLSGITTLGPAPAPLARKANQHRMQLLLKSSSRKMLQARLTQLRDWLTINKLNTQVRWNVDVDPMDLS